MSALVPTPPIHASGHAPGAAASSPAVSPALDLDTIYRAHAQAVARWATRLAGPSSEPEDIVQEVFLVAQRRLHEFRGEAAITTWLFRVTENVVRHRRRRERVRRFFGVPLDDHGDRVACTAPGPIEAVERAQTRARLYRVLDGLGEVYRTTLILFEIEGLSGEQIAELTGTRLATVWVRLHRARARFIEHMTRIERAEQRLIERAPPAARAASTASSPTPPAPNEPDPEEATPAPRSPRRAAQEGSIA